MRKSIALLGTGALLLAHFCSAWVRAQDVRYNFDQSAKFSDYRTYKWVDIQDAEHANELTEKMVKAALDKELATKGLTKTDSDTADLYIGYQTAVSTEKQVTSYSSGWGYGPGWRTGMASTTTTGSTTTIYIGQLVLDMYEAPQHKLVWRGSATKTLDPKAKPDKQEKNLAKAVAKLLKNYPPPTK
jgi:hypothetical protein